MSHLKAIQGWLDHQVVGSDSMLVVGVVAFSKYHTR